MILIINIGNSNIRFGLFDKKNLLDCKKSWIFESKPYKKKEDYILIFEAYYQENFISISSIEEIIVGSVVPLLTNPVLDALEEIQKIKPLLVNRHSISPIKHSSTQLGTDLYANAVSAFYLYKSPCLIIDFGTALTFTLVDEKGKLEGVIIAPGIKTSLNALIESAAQLKAIPLEIPSTLIGKDTQTSIQSGVIYGFISMVEGLIERIKKESPSLENLKIIATGGLSLIYGPLLKAVDQIDQLHTLKGIRLLYKFSKENQSL